MTLPALEVLMRTVAHGLHQANASFAIVGGLAVGARLGPRFTRDVDFAIAVTNDSEAEAILNHFVQRGFRPEVDISHAITGRLHTMRLIPPSLTGANPEEGLPLADFLFATSGIEIETVASATPAILAPDLKLPTARIPHLIAMKCLSESDRRLQDRIDLQNLCAAATPTDLDEAHQLVNLISQRGYAHDKDLHATLAQFTNAK